MEYDTTGPVAMGFGMLSRFCQVRLRDVSSERGVRYVEKVNKIWGGGCNE